MLEETQDVNTFLDGHIITAQDIHLPSSITQQTEQTIQTYLVSASIISIVTGLTPGIPGVTLLANTPVL